MVPNKAYNLYRENSVINASPGELTLMLYNGLIRFIMQAQHAIEEKDPAKAHHYIIKAQDIVMEFRITLDHQYEISQSLDMLYDYIHRQLVEANLKKDASILAEILPIVTDLRDTWAQALKSLKPVPSPGLEQAK
ncbi:flagellar protein FliS [Hydrogenispora ethanolica]|jgi:flagellar protein FliS|uniref:Flagellar secretion chaperone FliS n=1 Tax=Hydrogenispora ethanolica TaxID=1082276 RepID=A0A4R1RWW1_HYDET|nr:flagellar export chaperone FliS [Hydrogenispora ethanolica]TCL70989.1 flagellar protein FliS [Hydrogenispora ethanolica]